MAELPVVDMEVLAKQFDHAAWKGFNQSESEFEKGYKHAMSVAARVVRESAPASPAALRDEETEICPVCKDEVPVDSMLSYNNVPNAFCQQCVDSGKV